MTQPHPCGVSASKERSVHTASSQSWGFPDSGVLVSSVCFTRPAEFEASGTHTCLLQSGRPSSGSRHWLIRFLVGTFGGLLTVSFFLCPYKMEMVRGERERDRGRKSTVWGLFLWDTNSINGLHPCNLTTPQRHHLQIPSHWRLGLWHTNFGKT